MNIQKALEKIRERRRELWSRMDAADWAENDHPRESNGRFAPKGGGSSSGASGKEKTKAGETKSGGESSEKKSAPKQIERRHNITATKGGNPFPKLRKGAKYTKALSVAQDTALADEGPTKDEETGEVFPPRLPKGAWENTVKNLKDSDVVYIKDEHGKDIAVIPGLAAKVDNKCKKSKKMQQIFDEAQKDSEIISKDMISITKEAGMSMDGLENCCKGASHLEDKAKRKFKDVQDQHPEITDLTEEDVAKNLGDAVRFTAITTNDNIAEGTKKLISSLEKKGYKVTEVDNKFKNKDGSMNDDATYRAIHLTVEMPSGRNVEVQVHSAESMAVKNMNHKEYDKQNDMKKKDANWKNDPKKVQKMKELDDIMIQRWHDNYENPKGIETINSYDRRSKEFRRAGKM